ncbi:CDP-glycerol glycerophosphotransferase family protein [Halocatena pleomorpha]|uniref:Glycosyl/glycerophosphate transferase n=1 Tax=Halocatena pleomorpha TaxID=1785090 RepID=A0A3P3R4C3_9EURY|nr:CDP-glycerol glycerophosphotransferase family protein [Halocatena pleomorpha]RRJ28341.1 glycosyl/glycerophosphate transferase [Halocatena pleomorpha]
MDSTGVVSRVSAGLTYLWFGLLYVLSFVWPKDETLWVFGAKEGSAFVDNSKYLYLHTVEERPNVRAVWLSRNESVVETLQSQGHEAYHADSFRGTYASLRASVAYVSHGTRDVNVWCAGGTTIVGLWHGIMLKQVEWDAHRQIDHPIVGPIERGKYALFKQFDRLTVTSEAMVEPFASGRNMDPSRVVVTGYPRNDLLDGTFPDERIEAKADIYEMAAERHKESNVFLYAPTFHEETGEHVGEHLDLSELDAKLTEIDAYLIVKPHPRDQIDVDRAEYSRIISMPSPLDVYPLLPSVDALITDYSSLYFDYLLLDRPVIFYPFDRKRYGETRGFNLNYDAVTPGPVATEFEELLASIESVVETDEFANERDAVREEFLQPLGTNRCEAVCDQFDPTRE